ncbi:MAG: CBS domain-containing protein, partial [Candidatus Hydrogenedentales bacterium]
KDPNKVKVSEAMTKGVQTISPDADVEEAMNKMKESQIRRLIVMDNGDLKGIVSLGDLALNAPHDQMKGETLERISEPA